MLLVSKGLQEQLSTVCAPGGAHSTAMEPNIMQIGKEILLENE